MEPIAAPLRMFGSEPEADPLAWSWVSDQLAAAGTYWVLAAVDGPHPWPHPRPVWGVWADDQLHLSLGSPVVRRQVAADPHVTVHLDSGVDVVVVEGLASVESDAETRTSVAAYDAKYDWVYDLDQYGPFTRVEPDAILAWRAAGPAGRDGFTQVGRWIFPEP
ncbi:MAG: hypothetical protein ACXWBN_21180 [Acidimicrobiales bacterium]